LIEEPSGIQIRADLREPKRMLQTLNGERRSMEERNGEPDFRPFMKGA